MRLVAPGFITGNEHSLAIIRCGVGTETHSQSTVYPPSNVNRGTRSNADHPRKTTLCPIPWGNRLDSMDERSCLDPTPQIRRIRIVPRGGHRKRTLRRLDFTGRLDFLEAFISLRTLFRGDLAKLAPLDGYIPTLERFSNGEHSRIVGRCHRWTVRQPSGAIHLIATA